MPSTKIAVDRYESLRIFDCHGHCGPCRKFFSANAGSIESMIEVMDRSGIERLVFSSMLALYYDERVGNREMMSAVERYPGRLFGYVALRPGSGEQFQIDELEAYREVPGIAGVKIHPGLHETRPTDPGYDPIYSFCAESGYPLLSHTWGESDIEDFDRVLSRFPRLRLILGHAGGPSRRALERACDLAYRYDEVYLDITCSRTVAGLIEWMAGRAPVQRILFGSDIPFIDPRPAVGLVLYARVTDAVREAIFFENADRLYNLVR